MIHEVWLHKGREDPGTREREGERPSWMKEQREGGREVWKKEVL